MHHTAFNSMENSIGLKGFIRVTVLTPNVQTTPHHSDPKVEPGSKDIKLVSCSTQLSMNFHCSSKGKMVKMKTFLALKLSDVVFILVVNVKMTTVFGVITLMCRINFVLN